MTAEQIEQVLGLYNYWIVIFLMMTGFYIVIARNNLIKTVIGLNVFQISVILLYITMGKVVGGTAPIVPPALVSHGHEHAEHESHSDHPAVHVAHGPDEHLANHDDPPEHNTHATDSHANSGSAHTHTAGTATHSDNPHAPKVIYSNALPSVLMLTAIVVGVATTALALALIVRIREDYGTIEEDEILELDRAA